MMLRSLFWILEITLEMVKIVRNTEFRLEELTTSVGGPEFDS